MVGCRVIPEAQSGSVDLPAGPSQGAQPARDVSAHRPLAMTNALRLAKGNCFYYFGLPDPTDKRNKRFKDELADSAAMDIQTTRFGTVAIEAEDVLHFPTGLVGLEDCQHWVLLADAQNDALGWLQSTSRPEVALAVVTPRRFVPDYQVRIVRSELAPLAIARPQDAKVLVIVGKNERSITLNLKAPLVLNLDIRMGKQVVANNEYSIQHELSHEPVLKKKIA
jgi:flagellar assembly factor FliW